MTKTLPTLNFIREQLPGGPVIILAPRTDTRLAALNLLYRVGSRNEHPELTGLAHLMEHLMFSGTDKYPAFDLPVTRVGGVNNAFTTQDLTNYYILLPAGQIGLAIDMESDRLRNLNLDEQRVEVQKKVVIEEFNQRYLNQPYGDLNHLLSAAAWKHHPYRWPTIGLEPGHITSAGADDIRRFHQKYYHPANLIVSVAGNIDPNAVRQTLTAHFGNWDSRCDAPHDAIPAEPLEERRNRVVVTRKVPASLVVVAFPIPATASPLFPGFEFLNEILGQGLISRLHLALVKEKQVFTRISSSLTGTIDPGLFTLTGTLHEGEDPDLAIEAIQQVINDFATNGPTHSEMISQVNGLITATLFKRQHVMNLAMELAMAEYEEHAELVNTSLAKYLRVEPQQLAQLASEYLIPANRIEIHYLKA